MCILALCQHKCFFSYESFAFLIHSFFLLLFLLLLLLGSRSSLSYSSPHYAHTIYHCFYFIHHFTSFYSRQFHYRFKILLFNCFSIRFLFESIYFRFCFLLLFYFFLSFYSCTRVFVSVSIFVIIRSHSTMMITNRQHKFDADKFLLFRIN